MNIAVEVFITTARPTSLSYIYVRCRLPKNPRNQSKIVNDQNDGEYNEVEKSSYSTTIDTWKEIETVKCDVSRKWSLLSASI